MREAERKFLHDIASPLMVAIGALDVAQAIVKKSGSPVPALLERLAKIEGALEKVAGLLKDRRTEISKD